MREELSEYVKSFHVRDYPTLAAFIPEDDLSSNKQLMFEVLTLNAAIYEYCLHLNVDDERESRRYWLDYENEMMSYVKKQLITKEEPKIYMDAVKHNMQEYQMVSRIDIQEILNEIFVQFGRKVVKIATFKRDFIFRNATPHILKMVNDNYRQVKIMVYKDKERRRKEEG